MLHCSILPVHGQFSRFLSNLRYIVVDEGHAYRCLGAIPCHFLGTILCLSGCSYVRARVSRLPVQAWLVTLLACHRGVFGCHAALVLRRLQRICQREYRRDPRFIVASATIANPQEHIQQLLGDGSCHPCLLQVQAQLPWTF